MVISSSCKSIFKPFWWFKMFFWLTSCQIWKPLLCIIASFLNVPLHFLTKPKLHQHLLLLLPSTRNLGRVTFDTSFPCPPQPAIFYLLEILLLSRGSALLMFSFNCYIPAMLPPPSSQFFTHLTDSFSPLKTPHRGLLQRACLWPLSSILSEAPCAFFHGSHHSFIFILIYASLSFRCAALQHLDCIELARKFVQVFFFPIASYGRTQIKYLANPVISFRAGTMPDVCVCVCVCVCVREREREREREGV